MSKTFNLRPVFGPAVSVKSHGFSRNVAVPARRPVMRSVKKMWAALPAAGTPAVYGLFLLFVAGTLSYIFLINGSAAKGYEMKKIQNRIQEQDNIRHSLEIKSAELSSLGAIDQAAETARLVGIKNEEFLNPATITAFKSSK